MVAADVILGRQVKVQNNVSIYSGVICEDYVFLGPSCVFTNVKNPRSEISRREQYKTTRVRRGATVGANATVGRDRPVRLRGRGAVVTHSVPDHALVEGVPARVVGWMSRLGHRLEFDEAGRAVCPESGRSYRKVNECVYEEDDI